MKEINDYLKSNNIRALSYKINGNAIISNTNKGKIVIKKNNQKEYIFDYLNSRNFDYYPKIINNDYYTIYKYEENIDMPREQKIFDLVNLVALMHSKTTYYKEVSLDDYKKIYEDLVNNFDYLYSYYDEIINKIDNKVFMSPSEFLLARNINSIFNSINIGKEYTATWYDSIKELNTMRVSVVHNNLDLSHFIKNKNEYLISWDKSKIDIPIFDLFNLYNNHFMDFDFIEVLKTYEKKYPLKEYEILLFFILILMPKKIEFNDSEFNMCKKISNEIDRIYKSNKFVNEYKKLLP